MTMAGLHQSVVLTTHSGERQLRRNSGADRLSCTLLGKNWGDRSNVAHMIADGLPTDGGCKTARLWVTASRFAHWQNQTRLLTPNADLTTLGH